MLHFVEDLPIHCLDVVFIRLSEKLMKTPILFILKILSYHVNYDVLKLYIYRMIIFQVLDFHHVFQWSVTQSELASCMLLSLVNST